MRVSRKPVGAGLAPAPRTRQITHKRTVREAGPYKDGANPHKPAGAGLAPAPRIRQITHKRTVREAGPYKDGATFAQTGRGGFHIRPSLSDISPGTWPSSLDKSFRVCYNKDTKELRQRMCRCREAPIEYRRQENKRIRLQDSCVRFLIF